MKIFFIQKCKLFGGVILLGLFFVACDKIQKLDKDGGYYDEKTQTYKYVQIGRKTINDDPQKMTVPREGLIQQVQGKVVEVDSPNTIFLQIPERQTYMLLSKPLSTYNKDDKNRLVRFYLRNVKPMLLGFGTGKFRKQWKKYVTQKLERELLDKGAVVTFGYEGKTNFFPAVVTVYSSSVAGKQKLRNINLWIIEEGLSHYIFDTGDLPPNHKNYLRAEKEARKQKKGLWKYSKNNPR